MNFNVCNDLVYLAGIIVYDLICLWSQLVFTFLKLTMEVTEQCVKSVQS